MYFGLSVKLFDLMNYLPTQSIKIKYKLYINHICVESSVNCKYLNTHKSGVFYAKQAHEQAKSTKEEFSFDMKNF